MLVLPKQLHTSQFVQDMTGLGLDSQEFSEQSSRWLMWRSKPSPSLTWLRRWKRTKWLQLLSGRMLKSFHSKSFVTRWTSSLRDTHVSLLQTVVNEREQQTPDTSGLTSQKEFNFVNQLPYSSKTSKDISPLDSAKSLRIWKSLVTRRRGEYSQRQKLATATKENESSSWPTPTARDWKDGTAKSCENTPSNFLLGREVHKFTSHYHTKNNMVGKRAESCRLNEEWVEQLMGLPRGWTGLGSWEMESSLPKQNTHLEH